MTHVPLSIAIQRRVLFPSPADRVRRHAALREEQRLDRSDVPPEEVSCICPNETFPTTENMPDAGRLRARGEAALFWKLGTGGRWTLEFGTVDCRSFEAFRLRWVRE